MSMRTSFGAVAALVVITAVALIGGTSTARAAGYYDLNPEQVADDTYVFYGAMENFSFDNHGAISNTSFIVTADGVVVIDTGPSRLYGQAMRAAIAKVTDKPVVQVYITHAHPDHFLGNNAFEDVPIGALPGTIDMARQIGADLASNLYNLVGAAMRGTSAVVPTEAVEDGQVVNFGKHELQLIGTSGHTDADLMVLDKTTGVLFAGDIAFHDRAPTTPNADLDVWQAALAATEKRDFKLIVPGHGPASADAAPLLQTSAYLHWLRSHFQDAARQGESQAEVLFEPLPPRWARLAVEPGEYRRSVSHLYPAIERATLNKVGAPVAR
ncbi:quinoprotein relay system zinc metallohydrolase 1 [Salinisphaera aquimarina]|uniref:Quinoprotein relay system zinc metallohydrolase 1 n=1 Tax=Salinisphaera aquimarina TaxID=2094031 RepID=A0ABV7EKU9_9GAMM